MSFSRSTLVSVIFFNILCFTSAALENSNLILKKYFSIDQLIDGNLFYWPGFVLYRIISTLINKDHKLNVP